MHKAQTKVNYVSVNKIPPRNTLFEAVHSFIGRKVFLKFCLQCGFTPNTVTIFSGLCGILGAVLVFLGSPIPAFVMINLYAILDLVDGDIARERDLKSNFGYWLDIFFDKLIDFLLILALSYFAYKESNDPFLLLCGSLLMGFVFFNQLVLILNNTIFASVERSLKISTLDPEKSLNGSLAFIFLRKIKLHFSLSHNAFLFFISIYLLVLSPVATIIILTLHSFVTLTLNVLSNFFTFRGE